MTGDWSDSRVVTNTDRTLTSIQLIEKIEKLENECKMWHNKYLDEVEDCVQAYNLFTEWVDFFRIHNLAANCDENTKNKLLELIKKTEDTIK